MSISKHKRIDYVHGVPHNFLNKEIPQNEFRLNEIES